MNRFETLKFAQKIAPWINNDLDFAGRRAVSYLGGSVVYNGFAQTNVLFLPR